MASSLLRTAAPCCALLIIVIGACRRADPPREPPLTAQVSGSVTVPGIAAPVRVVRDRYGVPHIYARSRDDLFLAQGFVQAQDRLFQMDLWRRSVQGRLSEVLGANFIERDAMTRRIQYRGDLDAEWAAYGPDARAIAEAFTRGINAWVALARRNPPEPFVLAGWSPEFWVPEDLLNRTDGFLASGDPVAEVERAQMSDVVADAIRRIGTTPFFTLLAAPVQVRLKPDTTYATDRDDRSVRLQPDRDSRSVRLQADRDSRSVRLQADHDHELLSPRAFVPASPAFAEITDGRVAVAESASRYDHPSGRYLIHLNAPELNAIGATSPWRPGLAVGHNDHIAWGIARVAADTEHVREEAIDRSTTRVVKDTIVVKGRAEPFEYDTEITPAGIVITTDRERGRQFTLQWEGFEAGWAPELAALAIDVAEDPDEFVEAAAGWKSPPVRFVHATVDGQEGQVGQERREDGLSSPRASRERSRRAAFVHPLAITAAARERFGVGPVDRPRDDQPLRMILDPRRWDDSRAILVPGQSESPDSPHYADLIQIWSAGEMIPLFFSEQAVQANAAATLMLMPR